MSRHTTLDLETIAAIEKLITGGLPLKHAVAHLGLSHSTFRKQVDRGNTDLEEGRESLFADLAAAVARGRAARTDRWVSMLQLPNAKGELNANAIMFLLERLEPKDFGSSSKLEVEATVSQRPPRAEIDAELDKIRARLKGIGPGGG